MLAALSIRNIVLIDRLDLEFGAGLTALTGETGAGKSILLDAFALALGGRGDARLVRHGANRGQVTAVFELPGDHPAFALLRDNEIDADGELVLRRIQSADGRTRALINDAPVSIGLLRRLGRLLVEIHGQHDDRALTDLATHRQLLDAYAGLEADLAVFASRYQAMCAARRAVDEHMLEIEQIRERSGYLSHVLEELRSLDPTPGEEEELAGRRQVMMNAEKIIKQLSEADEALSERGGLRKLASLLRKLERGSGATDELLQPVTKAIEQVLLEVAEAQSVIAEAARHCRFEPRELEEAEERLFALREASRKHKAPVAALPDLMERIEKELAALDADEQELARLQSELDELQQQVARLAAEISQRRNKAARQLDRAVCAELAPLKLEKARFITQIETDREKLGPGGYDHVVFHVRTNPGAKPGPLMQVASGGELSRFILALKVVLAEKGAAPVLIFDEIDKGVGGATATAIGERLLRLAENVQALTVTHAPQIAALAKGHLQISKSTRKQNGAEQTFTQVRRLPEKERREEIARMLAGTKVTREARAAADQLMGKSA